MALAHFGADMAQAESCGLECFSDFDNLTQYHYVQTELCPSEGYLKSGFLTITQGFTLFRDVYIFNTLKTLTDDNKI